ncbi:HAMP domain-containing histidine kinase [Aliikangiella marina]|uniref:histidine kinase n=1 Tax=Aliikangiella marina TaxID=1712262 RepID=A0A545T1C8_9GAMM|nr:ATP-binding protein [Aliikangiella marina]TQV71020.1 HAMP domain-containing histidine kinase [Aliikangiella marina]
MKNISTNLENLGILNRVRFVAIISQLSLLVIATVLLEILLPLHRIFILITFEILFQLLSWHRLKNAKQISSKEVMIHIFFDSLILAGLIYFTGGANNPFIYLLLLPVALGTMMLRFRELVILALVQVALYSLLNLYQRPFELGESSPLASFHLHLLGMWVNFALTVLLIVIFGYLARQSLLKKEKQIQRLHAAQMKDEQVLSLGIMSANAAHQLGTPLSTMAIVVDDLKHETTDQETQKELSLVEQQIDKCRVIIQELGEKSQLLRRSSEEKELTESSSQLKVQLEEKLNQWLVFRPQIQLNVKWLNQSDLLCYSMTTSLTQAILNLLDNSADASIAADDPHLDLSVDQDSTTLVLKIIDRGSGISESQLKSIGDQVVDSTKSDGLGWGLFLSNASIQRAGGEVYLSKALPKGTITQIRLPLNPTVFTEEKLDD